MAIRIFIFTVISLALSGLAAMAIYKWRTEDVISRETAEESARGIYRSIKVTSAWCSYYRGVMLCSGTNRDGVTFPLYCYKGECRHRELGTADGVRPLNL